jgi:hypothetical protein
MNGHFLLLWRYPILGKEDHYFDPIGSYGGEADVLDKGNRI